MNLETATNYRAEVTFDDECTCTLTGSSLEAVKNKLHKLLTGPKLRFEVTSERAGQSGSLAIFHDSHFNAQEPIGWIAAYDVPANMSVKSVTQARLGQNRAA